MFSFPYANEKKHGPKKATAEGKLLFGKVGPSQPENGWLEVLGSSPILRANMLVSGRVD